MVRETQRLLPDVRRLPVAARLPLVEIAIGSLQELTAGALETFERNLRALETMDGRTSLFEWLIGHLVKRHLWAEGRRRGGASRTRRGLRGARGEASLILSAQAYASHRDPAQIAAAFAAGASVLGDHVTISLEPRERCGLTRLDEALRVLDGEAPRQKRALLTACARCAAADGVVLPAEAELMRALAAALSCPMPPIVATLPTP